MNSKFVFLLFYACSMAVFAADNTMEKGLTLKQVMIRVLENHPRFKVADYEAQAMAARLRQASLAPADRININMEDFAGIGNVKDVRNIEATLSLSRTLELGNKAAMRGKVVEQEALVRLNQREIDRMDLLSEAARRFVQVAADQERLRIAEDAIALIRLTEKAVEDHIRVGKTPIAERQRITVDLANYELDLAHKRYEMENSRLQLATLWNDRQPDFADVEADIFHLEPLPDFSELTGFLERNPDLIHHIRAEHLARAKIRLAESKRKPDLDLSVGLRYLGKGDDLAFVLSASVPLGSSNRARHHIEEAEALSRINPLDLEQQRMELYAMLFEIYQELKYARNAVDTLLNKIIPATEKMLDAYEKGFQTGRYSLLELIQIQHLLRNARSRSVDMAGNYHGYRIEIDRLTSAKFSQW